MPNLSLADLCIATIHIARCNKVIADPNLSAPERDRRLALLDGGRR